MEKSFRIMSFMCAQQQEEVALLLSAADDIGAAATAVARGMGYDELIRARDRFKELLLGFESHYRIFKEDE